MRLSRLKVVRLLQRARDENIVEMRITDASMPCLAIERQLVQHFGLRDAVVVPTDDGERLRQHLGRMAALYLERILRDGDTLGVGSGATVSEIPNYIAPGAI